jgi:hypothetical protein
MSSISSQEMNINSINNNINNNNNDNNNKFINNSPKPWAEYALFGSWTEEDLYETYKFAFYDRSIDIKELISLYMTWKQYCIRKE